MKTSTVPDPVVIDEPDYVEYLEDDEPPIIVPEQFNNKDVKALLGRANQ